MSDESNVWQDVAAATLTKKLTEAKEELQRSVKERSNIETLLGQHQSMVDLWSQSVSDYETALAALDKYKAADKAAAEPDGPSRPDPKFQPLEGVFLNTQRTDVAGVVWAIRWHVGKWEYLFSSAVSPSYPHGQYRGWYPEDKFEKRVPSESGEAYVIPRILTTFGPESSLGYLGGSVQDSEHHVIDPFDDGSSPWTEPRFKPGDRVRLQAPGQVALETIITNVQRAGDYWNYETKDHGTWREQYVSLDDHLREMD